MLEPLGAAVPATRVLRLSSPPVNSLSLEVLQDLASSIAEGRARPRVPRSCARFWGERSLQCGP